MLPTRVGQSMVQKFLLPFCGRGKEPLKSMAEDEREEEKQRANGEMALLRVQPSTHSLNGLVIDSLQQQHT